ncbi:hypothetical protein SAY87_027438 [Trapa incisa]|uniref:FAS1 domain-containing protein n=1 Tax=Trapa incisa TaxID=236973 RepID=A0AAN7GW45_9MYRT|nr:hypothetical protein SAY87_027438 [Trapa incisa]
MGFSSPLVSFTFLLPIFLFLLSSATALNITRVLGHYPQFSSFNTHLSRTLLADSINGGKKNKVTVLAVDNSVMSKISSESTEEEVERILRLHLLRGYYRERNLLELSSRNASLPTFHPEGPVQVKAMKGGGVGLGVAAEGSELSAKLVKPIFHHAKDNISVLQISDLLQPQNNVGNCIAHCPAAISRKDGALPIDTNFTLPGPLPSWPAGKGFASGTIDLGGLLVQQVTSFTKIWAIVEGGPDDLGVTFFEPSVLPEGYFMLGSYAQPNNRALYGGILVGKDATNSPTNGTLKNPIDYTLIWSHEGSGYIWLPVPPEGYQAVGHVVTTSPQKPPTDKVQCVRSDLTDQCETETWIWGTGDDLNVFTSRPSVRGVTAPGVGVGAFFVRTSQPASLVQACLKNTKLDMSSMPNKDQIKALARAYSPLVYFHPDEEFLPSSVNWLFDNGALLYKKGDEANPVGIDTDGTNLPQGGSNDGEYWLDLPPNDAVKMGFLETAQAYLNIKPMQGATFTDIVIWIFYPFNGPAKAKVKFFDVSLGKIGEHVGDWEHLTLRISNFDGRLWGVYLSQHSSGIWVSPSELEFQNTNTSNFVAYSSLHGHAMNPSPGTFLQGDDGIGLRNDFDKSDKFMNIGASFSLARAQYLGAEIVEPAWMNYSRQWGPTVNYDFAEEMQKAVKILPGKLKDLLRSILEKLPAEILGEEGPTGPNMKPSWLGDEM